MSDSYRKTPIVGITTADSDKEFKRQCSRAKRRAEKVVLARVTPDFDDVEIPCPTMGAWGEKDGKRWMGHIVDQYPELMRK